MSQALKPITMTNEMERPIDLIVALDYDSKEKAQDLINRLKGVPVIYKIGFELMLAGGSEFVKKVVDDGNRVFLDMKLHDIPNTVAKAVKQACALGVEFVTIHLSGGKEMLRAAVEEANAGENRLKLLGVTVLTSFDQNSWMETTQAIAGAPSESLTASTTRMVQLGMDVKLPGLVCSGLEVGELKALAPKMYRAVPGVRPAGSESQDQKRVLTPREAKNAGASGVVVGRPITQSEDPAVVAQAILAELGRGTL